MSKGWQTRLINPFLHDLKAQHTLRTAQDSAYNNAAENHYDQLNCAFFLSPRIQSFCELHDIFLIPQSQGQTKTLPQIRQADQKACS